jgi:FMN-dependent oxidoreductase (nitrilotriacetate monooxygenase family)
MPRQIRLNLNLQTAGRHDAAWKQLGDTRELVTDVDYYAGIAKLAERGKLDAIFLADSHGSLRGESTRRPWRGLDPTVLLAAIARDTERIGLVSTVHAIYGHPFTVARTLATLDHVSHGRAAWNIITSQNPPTLEALGLTDSLDHDTRYGRAQEFVEIVTGLWDSLPATAIVGDAEHDVYIDESQTVPVDYKGQHYQTRAVLPLPGGYAGRPVLFQAGASEHSHAFGARWADALFTGQRTKELAQRFSADVKRRAAALGRDPDKLVVLPGLFVILGGTQAEAQRRKDELDELLDADYLLGQLSDRLGIAASALELDAELPYATLAERSGTTLQERHREQIVTEARERKLTVRQLLFNNLSGGHRVLIGTPEQIADNIIEWVDDGASDGFNVNIDVQTEGLEQFIDGVVAELQQRKRFRTEYEYETFRENLGVA